MYVYDPDKFQLVFVNDPPPAMPTFEPIVNPLTIPDSYLVDYVPDDVPGVVAGGPDLYGVGGSFW